MLQCLHNIEFALSAQPAQNVAGDNFSDADFVGQSLAADFLLRWGVP